MNTENTQNKIDCEKNELLIDEYLEGMISLKDKEIMDEHNAQCKSCEDYFKKTSGIVIKLNALPQDKINLSGQKKNDIWNKIETGIDPDKYKNEKKDDITSSVKDEGVSFYSKYKYYLTGIAAVILIGFIIYGVKNVSVNNSRLAQQNILGLDTYWKVSNIQGSSLIGGVAMANTDSIKEGQWIKTNESSRAELIIADIGKVIIEPNSKVIFVKGTDGNNRILVEYGTINADMKTNDKSFFVEMPSAVSSDHGGSYTMTIDTSGDGLVYVKSGKVEVESPNREAIIPAGNLVMTKKFVGVGTPYNENSSEKFKNALYNFDFGKCNNTCISTLLNNAKMSDAVTLVNLIPNVDKEYKDEVYAKVANFVSPPIPPSAIHGDSIPFMDEEKINEWIDKIQIEVQENVERSMKEVEKNLEQIKEMDKINMDSLKALEDFSRNWKFNIKTSPKGKYEWSEDTTGFDKEEFKENMKDLQNELKENSEYNKENLKEDMEQLKEDLKEMKIELKENLNLNSEEIKKEMKNASEEMKKAMKEVNKINIPDSIRHKIKIDIKTNDAPENPEEMETPEVPKTEDSKDNVVPETPKVDDQSDK